MGKEVGRRKKEVIRKLIEEMVPEWADGLLVDARDDPLCGPCHYAIPVKRIGNNRYCYKTSWDKFPIDCVTAKKLGMAGVVLLRGEVLKVKDWTIEGKCVVLLTE
jgi:hypothetical protein